MSDFFDSLVPGEESNLTDDSYLRYADQKRAAVAAGGVQPTGRDPALSIFEQATGQSAQPPAEAEQEPNGGPGVIGQARIGLGQTAYRYLGAVADYLPGGMGEALKRRAAASEAEAADPASQPDSSVEVVARVLGRSALPAAAGTLVGGPLAGVAIAAGDAAFQTTADERLVTLLDHYPAAIQPFAEWLKGDPSDTEGQARFKSALDGALGFAVGGVLFKGLKGLVKGGKTITDAATGATRRVGGAPALTNVILNNMLSNPLTHAANVSMTSSNYVFDLWNRTVARAVTQGPKSAGRFLTQYVKDSVDGSRDAIRFTATAIGMKRAAVSLAGGRPTEAWEAAREALTQSPVGRALIGGTTHKFEHAVPEAADLGIRNPQLRKVVDSAFHVANLPTKALGAEDEVFRTSAMKAERTALGNDYARELGYAGEQSDEVASYFAKASAHHEAGTLDDLDYAQIGRLVRDPEAASKVAALEEGVRARSAQATTAGRAPGASGSTALVEGEAEIMAASGKKWIADFTKQAANHGDRILWTREFSNNSISKSMQKFANSHPVIQLHLPFIRTTENILRFIGHYGFEVPAEGLGALLGKGKLHRELMAGGRQREAAIARLVGAASIWGSAISLYQTGRFSGRGPMNYKERIALEQAGIKSDTVEIGKDENGKAIRIGYNRFNPAAHFIGSVADVADIIAHSDGKAGEQIAMEVVAATAERMSSQWYMENLITLVGGLLEATQSGDEKAMSRLVRRDVMSIAQNLPPYAALFRARAHPDSEGQPLSAIDQQGDPLDEIISRWGTTFDPTQAGGANGPPRRDGFGDVMFYHQGWSPLTFTEFPTQIAGNAPSDKALRALADAGHGVRVDPNAFRSVGSGPSRVNLTAAQSDELIQLAYQPGPLFRTSVREEIDALAQSPDFKGLAPEAQRDAIEDIMRRRRQQAKRNYQYKNEDVRTKVGDKKRKVREKKAKAAGAGGDPLAAFLNPQQK